LRSGKVVGVVCHEHVGAPREFDEEERAFAGSIGDLVALVLETNDRLKLERERARLSERIARMQQVERVGVLAGGLVHDFRNLLQIIAANVDMLRYELSSEKANRLLADVSLAIERANDLCTRLLSVQTEEPRRANEVDAAAVCREVVALLQPRVPAGAALEVVAEASGPTLLGDEAEVRQVLINLVLNALEAVAARPGPVTIRLAKHTPGKLTGMAADFRASAVECVLVEVEDAGVGIAPEQLQRIFEPFFTTKLDGHGFGLTSVMGVVRASGGAIQVDSEPGRGTLFRVWFPAGSGAEVPPAAL
jgi:signal transduction histidine kinase